MSGGHRSIAVAAATDEAAPIAVPDRSEGQTLRLRARSSAETTTAARHENVANATTADGHTPREESSAADETLQCEFYRPASGHFKIGVQIALAKRSVAEQNYWWFSTGR